MRSLPLLANLNNGYRKAAAPNNGAAAFFYSTVFYIFRHTMPLFAESLFVGNASKKAMQIIGSVLPVTAKNVAKHRLLSIFLTIAIAAQGL